MPSALSETCMKFRLETLAPSGGWLASVAIGISLKSGIYEYTILAIIFMISFIILRTASCETAMVLALAYDLVIPFQYQNVQRHTAELEKYWPKFLLGTAIEAGCYLLFHPDLFNLAVIIKTSVLLIVWMKGKKQYPLNLAKDNQPRPTQRPSSSTRDPSQPSSSSSSSDVTPEYIDYVVKELAKCTGEDAVSKERIEDHKAKLRKKPSSQSRQNTEQSLKKRKIMLFKDWQAAQGGGGQGRDATQGAAQQTGSGGTNTGNQPQAANHRQPQTQSAPPATRYQFTKPTNADIEQLKLDLAAKKSSFASEPEVITIPLLAGPDHPEFAQRLNYLRYKGINTRKWVPMVSADRTMYRVPDQFIKQGMDVIDGRVRKPEQVLKVLRSSYPTQEAFNAAMAELLTLCGLSIKPEMATQDIKVTPHGEPWYDYQQKIQAATLEGPDEVSRVETLYDYLNDPNNVPKKGEKSQKAQWWTMKETEWGRINLLDLKLEDNEWYPGTAGIPVEEIAGYRLKLESLGEFDRETKNAIIRTIKDSPNADQGRALWQSISEKFSTRQGRIDLMKEWDSKTKSGMAYAEKVKAAEAKAAAAAAAAAA